VRHHHHAHGKLELKKIAMGAFRTQKILSAVDERYASE